MINFENIDKIGPTTSEELERVKAGAMALAPEQNWCDCESYEPCYGECCGVGNCTCTPQPD